MTFPWPRTYCRECDRIVGKCQHKISHAHDLAPCDCPPIAVMTGVDWLPVYVIVKGRSAQKAVYECCNCEKIWIVGDDGHDIIGNPTPLQIEETILGKFDARTS